MFHFSYSTYLSAEKLFFSMNADAEDEHTQEEEKIFSIYSYTQ